MKLYFSPLACSLATRISLYEAKVDATYVQVDPKTKKTSSGEDFRTIHELGLVPVLELESGERWTENAAILQLLADRHPEAKLAPQDRTGRARLHQLLCFVGTELHQALFSPLLDKKAPAEVKTYALSKASSRLNWLAKQLEGRELLLEHFSVADAYLFAVLNWARVTPVDLDNWPVIRAYHQRLGERPAVTRAFTEELGLYQSAMNK